VTRFAAATSLRVYPRHALFELPLVWILVAGCAGKIAEMKWHGPGVECIARFVAFVTRRRDVAAGQDKLRFFVARQGKSGRPVSIQGVTFVAAIEIWRSSKLPLMLVLVAIGALGKLHFENRRAPCWDVALLALHRLMFSL